MPFVKRTSSPVDPVRSYLEGVAKNLADRLWGPNGPAWGTPLTAIEDLVVEVRNVLSEKMLHAAVERQAREEAARPAPYRHCPSCRGPVEGCDPEPRTVTTRAGSVDWDEPRAHCPRCRRAFFPSVQEPGDRSVGVQPVGAAEGGVRRGEQHVVPAGGGRPGGAG